MKITGAMTAIATPMSEDGAVDYSYLNKLIDYQIDNSISAIVAVGTTGESATIDFDEHVSLIEYFVKYIDGRVKVIAGTGANSTIEALELTKSAKDAGADAALLVSPYYNKPTQEGLFLHHTKIADEVNLPQILYNVPSRTACFIEAETVSRLSLHKNIIGIKDATGELKNLEEIQRLCEKQISEDNFFLYSGDDASSCEFMKRGGHGTISVSSNIVPKLISEMTELAISKSKEAEKINKKIDALNEILFVESNPIPVKYALYLMDLAPLGIRLPLTVLDQKYRDNLKQELIKLQLI
ncbi:MAG: 4-hydroxy-tetrahydrodipicolinate synthase [Gammaproteobacteria bacterium]|jgi:4-hydroxy-tetrahydrodipicolinate synthase|nr:4-hydroxy-tetrahydrodipicolinate synthase [Gammaproteobacteria bacterium]|tara:strand:- start:648 stop:1538 length:891 start_codon:yes stop_codon:yes gene_type:complete